MVNIREFYEAEGEEKPGRKGISLPVDQWHKLAAGFNVLSDELQKQTSQEDD